MLNFGDNNQICYMLDCRRMDKFSICVFGFAKGVVRPF